MSVYKYNSRCLTYNNIGLMINNTLALDVKSAKYSGKCKTYKMSKEEIGKCPKYKIRRNLYEI